MENKMKKQLLLTTLIATTVFSTHASDAYKKAELCQNYAINTAVISAGIAVGFFLKSVPARIRLASLVREARKKNTERGFFWAQESVQNLTQPIRTSKKIASFAATISGGAFVAAYLCEDLKKAA
jgi:hypothetical protein